MGHDHDSAQPIYAGAGTQYMSDTDKPHQDAPDLQKAYGDETNLATCVDLNCDWGNAGWSGKAGACWDCFKLEPCCGEPCNAAAGCYCCLCWTFCSPCTFTKLLAYSMDQECFVVNHCGPVCIAYCIAVVWAITISTLSAILQVPLNSLSSVGYVGYCGLAAILRHNLRVKFKVGSGNSWVGDWFMGCCPCTAACNGCQECRSVPVEGWDWLADCKARGCNCIDNNTLGNVIRKI